ncbi:uncharacterized protein LOC120419705 [Culex pipiens pallens]|uniref:uncharacterized protein LOC120419705 n=1 Tax=Culex pipiens pallens TaxID=42434 RepID=UPI001954E8C0|nr:uncharacterized protein LOC120419705 [Culex pipiens pallens]
MAVAFNVPSVHEDDEGQWKPANQLGQPNQQPQHQHPHHHHHVGASTNVSQQVRLSAENGQHRLVAAFHQILAAYARHAILAQEQQQTTTTTTSVPPPSCVQCEKLHYLLRLLH